MFTTHFLVQKLEEKGDATFHLLRADSIKWMFENRRAGNEMDAELFPFIIDSENLKHSTTPPSAETTISLRENTIVFEDNYGVPGGFTIAILFPENFIPSMMKFKEKPIIPVGLHGQFVSMAQGQFEIFYNQFAKRSAIVFNIHQPVAFGFKCIAKKVSDEAFPESKSIYADDFFDVVIDSELLEIECITNEDLGAINQVLGKSDLDDILNTLNELLAALKKGDKKEAKSSLDKFGKYVLNGTSLIGNVTKIADSFIGGGAPAKLIGKLFEYVSL